MNNPRNIPIEPRDVLDQDLEHLLHAALDTPARPMTAAQIERVVQQAREAHARFSESFPFWALAAFAVCFAGLALAAWDSSASALLWIRLAAAFIPLANLIMAPFAALVIIKRKGRKLNVH